MIRRSWPFWLVLSFIITLLGVVSFCSFLYSVRDNQFKVVQREIESLGATLNFDLVDGNYIVAVESDASNEEQITALVRALKELPTGFTWIGPGEHRDFWLTLSKGELSDACLKELSCLSVSELNSNADQLTKSSIGTVASMNRLWHLSLGNSALLPSDVEELKRRKKNVQIDVFYRGKDPP